MESLGKQQTELESCFNSLQQKNNRMEEMLFQLASKINSIHSMPEPKPDGIGNGKREEPISLVQKMNYELERYDRLCNMMHYFLSHLQTII